MPQQQYALRLIWSCILVSGALVVVADETRHYHRQLHSLGDGQSHVSLPHCCCIVSKRAFCERATVGCSTRNSLSPSDMQDLEVASLTPVTQLSPGESSLATPGNVSGTYKGSWSASEPMSASDAMSALKDGHGTVAFQLKTAQSSHDEVLDVQVCPFCDCNMPPLQAAVVPVCQVIEPYSLLILTTRWCDLSSSPGRYGNVTIVVL